MHGHSENVVIYHDKDKVRIGGVVRYEIEINTTHIGRSLFLRVRNTEMAALRAAYLNGPFTLYVDMVPMDYSEYEEAKGGSEPKYENHLKAGSHFSAELKIRSAQQKWSVTVMSETLFSRTADVNFEITIGTTKAASKIHSKQVTSAMGIDQLASRFEVKKLDTATLWQQPLPRPNEPLHVCVLTHGLVSNVTADMLYLKELLDAAAVKSGENLVCKGYTGNVCRTDKGVKYLGKRLANWIVNELIPTYKPAKLSFVAHSLGGLIQTYALGYIEAIHPEALHGIKLENFVALASPLLGISNENPAYVQFALNFGVVGRTGLDLGLSSIPGVTIPLLEKLPGKHTRAILRRFVHRTVYANSVNDGIVPLRTASLLYLDWRAISNASAAEHHGRSKSHSKGKSPLSKRDAALMKQEQEQRLKKKDGETYLRNGHEQAEEKLAELKLQSDKRYVEELGYKDAQESFTGQNRSSDSSGPSQKPPSRRSSNLSGKDGEKANTKSGLFDLDNPLSNIFPTSPDAKKMSRFQTINGDSDPSDGTDDAFDAVGEKLPKKTSLIESGMSLLMPPHPNEKFITHPQERDSVIFHDRTYYQQDLPERRFKNKLQIIKGHREKVEIAKSEERIARAYHSGTSWRKVLVELLPEAHNNIIVRRRFSNAYGWPVVHHVVREHFLFPAMRNESAENESRNTAALQENLSDGSDSPSPKNIDASSPWSSDDETDREIDKEHDPQKATMLKIISQEKQH